MKKLLSLLFVFGLTLYACGTSPTQSAPPAQTAASSLVPTITHTPIPPTSTVTPLPTIPTFTPTFDVSTIVTVTPVEKAECPSEKIAENYDFDFLNLTVGLDTLNRANAEENALMFLDSYGAKPLVAHLKNNWRLGFYDDVTSDGIPEFAIGLTSFIIFACKGGQYEKILDLPPDGYLTPPRIVFVADNNKNGLPELTVLVETQSQGAHSYQIYEWDGIQFRNIIPPNFPNYSDYAVIDIEVTGNIHYEDTNKDSVKELIVDSGIPLWTTYPDGLPWRNKRTYYQWNGQYYSPVLIEFDHPEYQFQAIQDGDLATNQSEFDKALSLYQDAIFDNTLKEYSPEIRKNLQEIWFSGLGNTKPTPTPVAPDVTEYPRLAAYAYYRILLLHLVQGGEADAASTYQTLQETFGDDPYAAPYVEIASAFWEAYQSTHKMYDGCAATIQYAVEHPEILVPLGSNYHGWQSHIFEPADVCPFR